MRNRGREFAHGCEPGNAGELHLRDLQVPFARAKQFLGLLSFADIADKAGKYLMPIAQKFPERDFRRELLAILALSGDFNALPVEVALSSGRNIA